MTSRKNLLCCVAWAFLIGQAEADPVRVENMQLSAFLWDVNGPYTLVLVSEGSQNMTDLNGDGDISDTVPHVHDHEARI